jgi:hypothetical protein
VTLVDRGTQTLPHVPLFLPTGPPTEREVQLPEPPSLFTLSPSKQLKVRECPNHHQGSSTGTAGVHASGVCPVLLDRKGCWLLC